MQRRAADTHALRRGRTREHATALAQRRHHATAVALPAVPSLPNATVHPIIHTARYHLAVFARFLGLARGEAEPTREALRDMRDDMVAGVFPF